jgi:hypothetical protein
VRAPKLQVQDVGWEIPQLKECNWQDEEVFISMYRNVVLVVHQKGISLAHRRFAKLPALTLALLGASRTFQGKLAYVNALH